MASIYSTLSVLGNFHTLPRHLPTPSKLPNMTRIMDVETYDTALPAARREHLQAIEACICTISSEAVRSLKYKMPTFEMPAGWIAFGNQKHHIAGFATPIPAQLSHACSELAKPFRPQCTRRTTASKPLRGLRDTYPSATQTHGGRDHRRYLKTTPISKPPENSTPNAATALAEPLSASKKSCAPSATLKRPPRNSAYTTGSNARKTNAP